MKITKFVHSCLLVEMPEPVNRTILIDPGSMSRDLIEHHDFKYLDDILITHNHGDHMDVNLIEKLRDRFPDVRITATAEAVDQLGHRGITSTNTPPEGVKLFDAPHEPVEPLFPTPQEHGYHYLDKLTHPGDSHSFKDTMPVLALPVQGPWGAQVNAVKLALQLRPKYIIPIHDWHWSDAARASAYDMMEEAFRKEGMTFIKTVNGEPFVLDV